MANRPGSSNMLRLVGGRHRGRKLKFPSARGLRPTADRTRETLFNWLAPVINGSVCLDLFAGSGALGFEALSRGARHVTMLEMAMPVFRQLQQNADLLGETEHTELLHQSDRQFDVIFIDPPFKENLLEQIIEKLINQNMVKPSGFIYVERDKGQQLPDFPDGYSVIRDKTAGQVAYSLIEYG
jgi:16S rRNA (guanine966-N2)-methyltransferase